MTIESRVFRGTVVEDEQGLLCLSVDQDRLDPSYFLDGNLGKSVIVTVQEQKDPAPLSSLALFSLGIASYKKAETPVEAVLVYQPSSGETLVVPCDRHQVRAIQNLPEPLLSIMEVGEELHVEIRGQKAYGKLRGLSIDVPPGASPELRLHLVGPQQPRVIAEEGPRWELVALRRS